MGFSAFGLMNAIFPTIFIIMFATIFGIFIAAAVQGAKQYKRNNDSPVLTVDARVVAKRADVGRHHHHQAGNTAMHHTTSSTTYYATFEVESGDRMELGLPAREYGMLVEGDRGRLTFQGTRYLSFDRSR